MAKTTTKEEQIILYFQALTNSDDWETLYKMAHHHKDLNKLSTNSLPAMVSKWKNSERIQEELKRIRFELMKKEEEQKERILSSLEDLESEDLKGMKKRGFVNLLDRDEFLKEINKGANQAKDEKDKREYLKMISDNLRYKDSDKEESNDIQRFYTPITCQDCPLYKNAKGKITE